jgi:uncharacterized protein (DUF1330 family)
MRKHFAAFAAILLAACQSAPAPAGPKGYVIAEIEVTNPEPYKDYVAAATQIVAAHGGTYLVRGGQSAAQEGAAPKGRLVVIEFPSLAAAEAFANSPEYLEAAKLRQANAVSRVILVEGKVP